MHRMRRACFFSAEGVKKIQQQQYSLQDINILRDLGFEVVISSSLRDIPWDCDIYFGWWATGSIIPTLVAKWIGKPVIVVAGGNEAQLYRDSVTNEPGGFLSAPIYKRIAALATLHLCDKLVVVSQYMSADVFRLCKRNPVVIHNSVDTMLFHPLSEKREYVTSIFNMDETVVKLKRAEIYIRSIPYVVSAVKNVKFLVIGRRGNAYSRLKDLAQSIGVLQYLTFLECIPNTDVPVWMSRSLCYVQISDTETFGMSVAEAMACATPVVVSRRGAIPEVVGEGGMYVDHNDACSVAKGIIEVLTMDGVHRDKVGSALMQRISEKFSYQARKDSIARLIDELT